MFNLFDEGFGKRPRWAPSDARTTYCIAPPVGSLVGLDHRAWEVLEVRRVPLADWKPEDHERLRRKADGQDPEEWPDAPHYLIVRQVGSHQRTHWRTRARKSAWHLLPEHYAVCHRCGDVAPCREVLDEQVAARALERLARMEAILPGCCWGCGQPVTKRQKTIRFEGENLDLPGGQEVVFHTRSSCDHLARAYEERWVAAAPGRTRRLSCPGDLITHIDGTECTAPLECPGFTTAHRSSERHVIGTSLTETRCTRCKDALARQLADGSPISPADIDLDAVLALHQVTLALGGASSITYQEGGWAAEIRLRDGSSHCRWRLPTVEAAADAVVASVLIGRKCRCLQLVAVSGPSGCRWRRAGDRWVAGCKAVSDAA
ncbi:hypothetical protein [Nocardiopsis synnemataformans]|uniref:hypothetical protein n=1 Tax=Nocardiopsis synnemataformans TaxID=61305 RepID=UPI003EBB57F4